MNTPTQSPHLPAGGQGPATECGASPAPTARPATAIDCTSYALSLADASELAGLVLVDHDIRIQLLERYLNLHSVLELMNLFSQFVGMANSVVENGREMTEIILITEGGMWPNQAEKANLPTMFGACNGVKLAAEIDPAKTCPGCAFRLGTPANQSPCTTDDADWCGNPGASAFMCHEDLDDKGEPTKGCAGFAQLRVRRRAEA